MARAVARNHDVTTTRGVVIALSSTIYDMGKQVALDGDRATCGNCKGTYPIYGTGTGMFDHGRAVAVDGDLVLCPCGKNRVIAGADATIFLEAKRSAVAAQAATTGATLAATADIDRGHWIDFSLRDSVNCEGLRCTAHFDDGSVESGTFDGSNSVRFTRRSDAACIRVELSLADNLASPSVTDALLSAIRG